MGVLNIFYLLPFLFFPMGVVVKFQLFESAFVYPLDVAIVIVLLIFIAQSTILNKLKLVKPITILFIFLFWAAVSLLLNSFQFLPSEIISSFMYWIRFCFYIIFLLSLLHSPIGVKKQIPRFLFLSTFVFVVFGVIQYLYYPNLRNLYYLGWDEHLYRVFSTLLDPNFSGVILAMSLPFLILYLIKQKVSKFGKIFIIATLLVTITALFLTYSRTGYVVAIVSTIILLILLKKIKYLIIIFLVFFLGIWFIPKNLHSEGVDLLRTASIFSRVQANIQGFEIFKTNPIYGVGFNTLRYAKLKELNVKQGQFEDHSLSSVPNTYIFVLSTTGIIGLILFLYFVLSSLKYFYVDIKHYKNGIIYSTVAFSVLVGIIVGGFFENLFFYNFILFYLFVLFALSFNETTKGES